MRDPIFADIDLVPLEIGDVVHSFPGVAEAMLRLHTAYKEEQFALADRRQEGVGASGDPVAAVRSFLSARRNCFPVLDAAAEKLSTKVAEALGLADYCKQRHQLRVRRLPSEVMAGSLRRLDWHRKDLLLDDTLDAASQNFQLAQQLAYLEFDQEIQNVTQEGNFETESARRLAHRALAAYAAAAIIMPYAVFAKAVETRHYDIEALSRQFGTSFEQTAHRLTTLQKPGHERIPFFFIRVDVAGNVSKRLHSGNFHVCPPRRWLPSGERPSGFHNTSQGRNAVAGIAGWPALLLDCTHRQFGWGRFGAPRVERAIALVCEAHHAERLIYRAVIILRLLLLRQSNRMPALPPAGVHVTPGATLSAVRSCRTIIVAPRRRLIFRLVTRTPAFSFSQKSILSCVGCQEGNKGGRRSSTGHSASRAHAFLIACCSSRGSYGFCKVSSLRNPSETPLAPYPVANTKGIPRRRRISATGNDCSPQRLTSRIAKSISPSSANCIALSIRAMHVTTRCPISDRRSSRSIATRNSSSTIRIRLASRVAHLVLLVTLGQRAEAR